jgi:hypothetical protein
MQEEIRGPKYDVRLGQLKPWHVLRITCLQCRYVAAVSPAPLLTRFGVHQRIVDLEERFACTECGNRGGNSVAVCRLDRNT